MDFDEQEQHDNEDPQDAATQIVSGDTTDETEETEEATGTKKFVRNENPITGDVLSKLDVQALSEATTVTFIYEAGDAKIIARKEKEDTVYGSAILERPIVNVSGVIRIHDSGAEEPKSAVVLVTCAEDPTWQTIADSLREGDQVTLLFHLGVQDETLSNAGVSWDRFGLDVNRFDGRGRGALRSYEFHVADVFGTDSSDRMFTWE